METNELYTWNADADAYMPVSPENPLPVSPTTVGDGNGDTIDTSTLATHARQDTGNSSLSSIDGKLPDLDNGNLPVSIASIALASGASTETAQNSANILLTSIESKLPDLDGDSLSVSIANQPISVTLTESDLPTGAATSEFQDAGNVSLESIDSKLPPLSGSAVPVVLSSTPLPSGASTANNQDTGNTSLSNIDTKTPSLQSGAIPIGDNGGSITVDGQVSISNSSLHVDDGGGSITIDASTLPLPSGASTAALQTTSNTSLASIDGKLPALSNGSLPVVTTSAGPSASGPTTSTYNSYSLTNGLLTTAVNIKSTAGRLFSYRIYNPDVSVAYVAIYSLANATVGSTVPVELLPVPSGATLDGEFVWSSNYSAGITIACLSTPNASTTKTIGVVVAKLAYI